VTEQQEFDGENHDRRGDHAPVVARRQGEREREESEDQVAHAGQVERREQIGEQVNPEDVTRPFDVRARVVIRAEVQVQEERHADQGGQDHPAERRAAENRPQEQPDQVNQHHEGQMPHDATVGARHVADHAIRRRLPDVLE